MFFLLLSLLIQSCPCLRVNGRKERYELARGSCHLFTEREWALHANYFAVFDLCPSTCSDLVCVNVEHPTYMPVLLSHCWTHNEKSTESMNISSTSKIEYSICPSISYIQRSTNILKFQYHCYTKANRCHRFFSMQTPRDHYENSLQSSINSQADIMIEGLSDIRLNISISYGGW